MVILVKKMGEMDIEVTDKTTESKIGCCCKGQSIKLNQTDKIWEMISKLLENRKGAKAKIKL